MPVSRLLHVQAGPQARPAARAQTDKTANGDDAPDQDGSGQVPSFQDALTASMDRQKGAGEADSKVHKKEKPTKDDSVGEDAESTAASADLQEPAVAAKAGNHVDASALIDEATGEDASAEKKEKQSGKDTAVVAKNADVVDPLKIQAIAVADQKPVTPSAPETDVVDKGEAQRAESLPAIPKAVPVLKNDVTTEAKALQAPAVELPHAAKNNKAGGKTTGREQPVAPEVEVPDDQQKKMALPAVPIPEDADSQAVKRDNVQANRAVNRGADRAVTSPTAEAATKNSDLSQSAPAVAVQPAAIDDVARESGLVSGNENKNDAKILDGAPRVDILAAVDGPKVSAASHAEAAPAAQEPPRAETPDLMDQIVLGLKGKLDARSGKAEIRMDPPNMGTVKVSVSLDQGLLTAQFHSASEVVRSLLKDNLEKLKTVLESQGVTVDRLAVDAPADARHAASGQQPNFGSATHDGRSAGQYQQDARRQRPAPAESFSRLFDEIKEQPLDLVA